MNLTKYQLPPVSQMVVYNLFVAQRVKYMPKIPTVKYGSAWRGALKQLLT